MNRPHQAQHRRSRPAAAFVAAQLLLLFISVGAVAQSTDIGYPTPVSANQISGQIAARDVGDARLTRYFYTLTGAPGDLILTVTSNNLNGDVDLFTAGSLRPLGKISMYAGASATTVTKTVFLRERETLILRVEARSANDLEGTFSVRFEGSFEPVASAPQVPEEIAAASNPQPSSERGVRRVTSSGARIDEPEPEPSVRTEQAETAANTSTDSSNMSSNTPAEPSVTSPAPPAATTTARTRRPTRRTTRRRATPAPPPSDSSTISSATSAAAASGATLNPRLIIETRDGVRTERFMNTVKSVTVQNGQIVILSRDGSRIERISLANVLKMSIEP